MLPIYGHCLYNATQFALKVAGTQVNMHLKTPLSINSTQTTHLRLLANVMQDNYGVCTRIKHKTVCGTYRLQNLPEDEHFKT